MILVGLALLIVLATTTGTFCCVEVTKTLDWISPMAVFAEDTTFTGTGVLGVEAGDPILFEA